MPWMFSLAQRRCGFLPVQLAAWILCLIVVPRIAAGQVRVELHGHVVDAAGRTVAGAAVVATGAGEEVRTVTDSLGNFRLTCRDRSGAITLRANAPEMESAAVKVKDSDRGKDIGLTLRPSAVSQEVTVTATRSSADIGATANTVYAIGTQDLRNYPAAALDDRLRQQAGFELFRRAPSTIANPTSQGISLRGLGSTAASRTLVLANAVPMNDPFGGWVHWDEIPQLAVEGVTIATGGGSDLYGSSALGGVVDVVPALPSPARLEVSVSGGGQDTVAESVRADAGFSKLRELLAGDLFRNAGYIPATPEIAGAIDAPANVHYQAVRSETDRVVRSGRLLLTGDMLNEARGNGTRVQTNGTRLWRYIAGDDWSAGSRASGRARVFGSDEAYRQSFSSINATRSAETLTRLQHVRTQELGATADASVSLKIGTLVGGADVRDIRSTDNETPIASGVPSGIVDTTARQRFVGGFGEAIAVRGLWTAAISLRLDAVSNIDTHSITQPSAVPQPVSLADRSETVLSPRFGIVRQFRGRTTVHASVFRAFRTPTMNELYRTGQVGQETTQANAQLLSERATGWESGGRFASHGDALKIEGTYFWTEINRPVSAVFVSSTTTTILDKRQNLGQILSHGTELHADLRLYRGVSATVGYQYAHAVVTRFSASPGLVGNWIPQVPRQSFTAQVRLERVRWGEATIAARASGHAFDDSANTFLLRSFSTLSAGMRHDFGPHWSASVTLQNLLNERPDVARTPILTLGSPFLALGGVAFHWDRNATP